MKYCILMTMFFLFNFTTSLHAAEAHHCERIRKEMVGDFSKLEKICKNETSQTQKRLRALAYSLESRKDLHKIIEIIENGEEENKSETQILREVLQFDPMIEATLNKITSHPEAKKDFKKYMLKAMKYSKVNHNFGKALQHLSFDSDRNEEDKGSLIDCLMKTQEAFEQFEKECIASEKGYVSNLLKPKTTIKYKQQHGDSIKKGKTKTSK